MAVLPATVLLVSKSAKLTKTVALKSVKISMNVSLESQIVQRIVFALTKKDSILVSVMLDIYLIEMVVASISMNAEKQKSFVQPTQSVKIVKDLMSAFATLVSSKLKTLKVILFVTMSMNAQKALPLVITQLIVKTPEALLYVTVAMALRRLTWLSTTKIHTVRFVKILTSALYSHIAQ